MYLYVAETCQDEKTDVKIEVKKEITKEELEYLNSAFLCVEFITALNK